MVSQKPKMFGSVSGPRYLARALIFVKVQLFEIHSDFPDLSTGNRLRLLDNCILSAAIIFANQMQTIVAYVEAFV